MAKRISGLNENFRNIIAFVGDGHIPGISEILKSNKLDFNVIRLSELKKDTKNDKENRSDHFSISYYIKEWTNYL